MGRWRYGKKERWRDGELEGCIDDRMARWRDGEMERCVNLGSNLLPIWSKFA